MTYIFAQVKRWTETSVYYRVATDVSYPVYRETYLAIVSNKYNVIDLVTIPQGNFASVCRLQRTVLRKLLKFP
jgi:hypothetical protein